jgi:hypothetical protein
MARCAPVDFDVIAASNGLNVSAVAGECQAVGIALVSDLASYAACLERRHACAADALVQFETPRAAKLLDLVGRPLTSAFCGTP